jgi:polar amino acid transport system substrate-binding protein
MKSMITGILVLLGTSAIAEPLQLVTEDYPPFAFRDGSELKGAAVEQVELIMKQTGMEHRLEMMPWARALTLAEKQPMHCVFTTAHNAERHPHFKWVEPLLQGRTLLIRKAGSPVDPKDLDGAKRFLVGTTRGDFTADILKAKNFEKLDLAADFNLTLKKLMLGRVDLMPIAEDYYFKLRTEGLQIERVLVLSEQTFSLACNPSVPDGEIEKMQAALDNLIDDGTQAAIFKRYGLDFESQ